jgi:EAL and modified HD-GYP domain-containing signal transduction protein
VAFRNWAPKRAPCADRLIHWRQAIYDASLHSRAYELFYRASTERPAPDADRAACSLVLSAFTELGLSRVAGKKRVFLQVSHDVISGALPLPVPTEVVVSWCATTSTRPPS